MENAAKMKGFGGVFDEFLADLGILGNAKRLAV
jgi:hypothetical protein